MRQHRNHGGIHHTLPSGSRKGVARRVQGAARHPPLRQRPVLRPRTRASVVPHHAVRQCGLPVELPPHGAQIGERTRRLERCALDLRLGLHDAMSATLCCLSGCSLFQQGARLGSLVLLPLYPFPGPLVSGLRTWLPPGRRCRGILHLLVALPAQVTLGIWLCSCRVPAVRLAACESVQAVPLDRTCIHVTQGAREATAPEAERQHRGGRPGGVLSARRIVLRETTCASMNSASNGRASTPSPASISFRNASAMTR